MLDFKEIIADKIQQATGLNKEELKSYIEIPKDTTMGDYAFPCFKLAKELKKAPPMIAAEISEKLEVDEKEITKIEIVGGYINFYVNNAKLVEEVLKEYDDKKAFALTKKDEETSKIYGEEKLTSCSVAPVIIAPKEKLIIVQKNGL